MTKTTMLVTAAVMGFGVLCGAGASNAAAEEIKEPSTGHAFAASRTIEGKSFTLLGTGVRKKFIIKVYAMALYAEDGPARAAAKGKGLGGDAAASWFVSGGFEKHGVMHFVRSVDAEKIKGAYEESLADALADAELKAPAAAFIALFDREVKEGQEIEIHTTPAGRIDVTIAGQKKAGPTSARLAQAIWRIWLGGKPISSDLKKGLVERVGQLG